MAAVKSLFAFAAATVSIGLLLPVPGAHRTSMFRPFEMSTWEQGFGWAAVRPASPRSPQHLAVNVTSARWLLRSDMPSTGTGVSQITRCPPQTRRRPRRRQC